MCSMTSIQHLITVGRSITWRAWLCCQDLPWSLPLPHPQLLHCSDQSYIHSRAAQGNTPAHFMVISLFPYPALRKESEAWISLPPEDSLKYFRTAPRFYIVKKSLLIKTEPQACLRGGFYSPLSFSTAVKMACRQRPFEFSTPAKGRLLE